MIKLYRVYTVRENYKDRDTVIIDWFCPDRPQPAAPRENFINDYHGLNEKKRVRAGKLLDNFLILPEVEELKTYLLNNFGFEAREVEMKTPFRDADCIPDFSGTVLPGAPPGDYVHLHEAEDYDISVPVSGFYDLGEPPNLVSSV